MKLKFDVDCGGVSLSFLPCHAIGHNYYFHEYIFLYFVTVSNKNAAMSYSKFDLTFKIGQYLDRHLVFPLLEFLAAKEVSYKS